MATKKYYVLYVVSADTTTLAESFQDNKTRHFYVEVRVDQMKVQGTETVKGDKVLSWNDVFLLFQQRWNKHIHRVSVCSTKHLSIYLRRFAHMLRLYHT
ncbi:hypothetical protein PILCRDRAFT_227187 [Piloderma croceum F 1598]|uniref:Uncharacterized protein n=1 Tax=Piloderma croceum (strain F 1598) TaxID=765440 RepID=A0A0C3FYZ7_PILCF|nr:hypothetical protein PILCRDRAFT_227187 [Piloderma croceum F 1598]